MPQLIRIGEYTVYFRANENDPLEPFHVHVAKGIPSGDATKIWITQTGHCILCHNRSKIPVNILNKIMRLIEKNQDDIRKAWIDFFDEITYFC